MVFAESTIVTPEAMQFNMEDLGDAQLGVQDSLAINDSITTAHSSNSSVEAESGIVIGGAIIDSLTSVFPQSDRIFVTIDSFSVNVDSTGNFEGRVGSGLVHFVEISAFGYEHFSKMIQIADSKLYYFVTCALVPLKQAETKNVRVTEEPRVSAKIPWTISGSITNAANDLALSIDGMVLYFDSTIIPVSKASAFKIQTYIGGRHVFRVVVPGYKEIFEPIVLGNADKQPYVTLSTTKIGERAIRREINVSAKREALHVTSSVAKTTISQKELIRTVATTNDPLRVLQTLPGVAAQSDMSAQPIIRGGDPLESRIIMDGLSLIQPYHYGGVRSTANQLAMKSLTLYKSGFPAQYYNAQSGLVVLESRRDLDSTVFDFDLNMLQGGAYLSVPLNKERIALNASAQGSWQDFIFKRVLDVAGSMQGEMQYVNEFKKTINLPDYRDASIGLDFRTPQGVDLTVKEIFNSDLSKLTSPSYTSDSSVTDSFGTLVNPTSGIKTDTSLYYRSYYNILFAKAQKTIDMHRLGTLTAAWQKRWWNVSVPFLDDDFVGTTSIPRYDVSIDIVNLAAGLISTRWANHVVNSGIQLDMSYSRFNVDMLRALHQLIVEGNSNYADYIGPLTGDSGAVYTGNDAGNFGANDLFFGSILAGMYTRYKGTSTSLGVNGYIQDEWHATDRLALSWGMRLEFSSADATLMPSPRVCAKYSLNETHELIGALGMYTQNNYDLASLALSDQLKPEKVWHASIGEERRLLPWLTHKVDIYGKYYFDLTSEFITQDFSDFVNRLISDTTGELLQQYILRVNDPNNPMTTEEIIHQITGKDGIYTSTFENSGKGVAYGIDYMLRYNPADFWSGWISASLGNSIRQRNPGWRWHDSPFSRPLLLYLVNYYRLPRKYEIAVKYRFMSGVPYTEFSTKGDSALVIGPYNNKRYAPYHRFDFKISKGFELKHSSGHLYLEVWNPTNVPNFLLRDRKGGGAQSFAMNWPIPFIYLGIDLKF